MVNLPVAVRRSQPRSSSRLSLARTFSLWRPVTSMPARWAACAQAAGPPVSAAAARVQQGPVVTGQVVRATAVKQEMQSTRLMVLTIHPCCSGSIP